jgi:hypothetical protein
MKIQKVILKEIEIVDVEGEFKFSSKNEKTVPCFITNYATKQGRDLGLTETSLLQGVFKLKGLVGANSQDINNVDAEALSGIDETEMQKVVYLGCLGANPKFEYDFDAFLERYHYSLEETVRLYGDLIKNLASGKNNFAAGLKQSTKSGKKNRNHRK